MTVYGPSPRDGVLSLLDTARARARELRQPAGQGREDADNLLLAALRREDPERAQAFEREQSELQQTLRQLRAARIDIREQRKEAARQKVERLKAEIQALRLRAAIDPEGAARQAARLARELAAAAREYGGSGGGGAITDTLAGAAGAGATPGTPAATEQPAAPVAQATTAAGPAGSEAAAAGAPPAGGTAAAEAAARDVANGGGSAGPDGADDVADSTGLRQTIADPLARGEAAFGERQADAEFARDVRRLLNDLRGIVRTARLQLQGETDDEASRGLDDAEKALRDVERSLGDLSAQALTAAVTTPVDIVT